MSANKNALLEPDLPANKYAQLEAILAATDFPVKKRLNRKQFKEQIDAAKKSYAVYLSSAVKEPEKITYVEFLATKKKTTALVDSQKANVVVNEPLIAPYTKTPQPKNKRFVPFESPCDAPAFCFDYINFPILEKKGS